MITVKKVKKELRTEFRVFCLFIMLVCVNTMFSLGSSGVWEKYSIWTFVIVMLLSMVVMHYRYGLDKLIAAIGLSKPF